MVSYVYDCMVYLYKGLEAKSETLSDKIILGGINWYHRNVVAMR